MTYYSKLLSDSWKQSLRSKALWFIGIFISGLSFFITYDSDTDVFAEMIRVGKWGEMFQTFGDHIPGLIILILTIFVVILLSLLSLISKSALINGIALSKEEKTSFVDNFKFGIKKILPMIYLELMFLVPNIVLLVIILIGVKFNIYSSIIFILELLMLLYSLFILLFNTFSYCEINLQDSKPFPALINGYKLLIKNWKKTILVNLIRIAVSIGFWLANLLVLVIIALPFVLLAVISYFVGLFFLAILILILGGIALIGALFVVKGFKTAYIYTMLTRLYWDLKK